MQKDWNLPRGLHVCRAAIARALNTPAEAAAYAAARWGRESTAALITRATVGAGGGQGTWGSELASLTDAQTEFEEVVRGLTAFDRLPVRRVAKNVPVVTQTGAAVAYWKGQSKAAKLTPAAFDRTTLTALTVAVLAVFSNDTLRDESPETERGILADLVDALAAKIDYSFFDPSNSGTTDVEPASVSYLGGTVASTGSVQADVENALANFEGALRTSAWVAHPRTLAVIGLASGGKGVGADLGCLGGTLAGLPAYPCEALTADSSGVGPVILVDGRSVIVCDEGAELRPSSVSAVEMADDPAQDALAPSAATSPLISLFQVDASGVLGVRRLNWRLARANACVTITNASYGAS